MMKARIWIDELSFKNKLILKLKSDSIVVFVGPNNAGKSKILSEIYQSTKGHPADGNLILDKINLVNEGEATDLIADFENRHGNGNQYYYVNQDHTQALNEQQLLNAWNNFNHNPSKFQIANFFVKQLNTLQRLSLVGPPPNLNFMMQRPSHPIHFLKENENLEKEFSKNFKLAFGEDVIVNHSAGNIVPLHVGKRPETSLKKDRVSKEYREELLKLGELQNQGDGMKSFAGVFLGLMVENYSINIVDEPEAFLHPPQARLLGQMIAKNLGKHKQIFLATHSEDLLKGLLDHSDDRLIVVRIQREGLSNKINVLENSDIQEIWSDPLLRHSNILSGLFHSNVVLCESDGDCRFFSAISTAICESEGRPFPDTLYVESGGKARFPVVIKALKKLDVPLIVIGDFDLYDNESPLKTMYGDVGGDWNEIKDDFKLVKQTIDQKRPDLEVADLKTAIDEIFKNVSGPSMPEEKIKLIQKELKKSSPWGQAKSSGKYYLPAGDAMNAFNRVQQKLKEKGIQILEIGEMEAFDKTVPGHGPKWVNEVLTKNLAKDPTLEIARVFVKDAILT